MGTSGEQESIQNHGTAMDKDKNKVRCNYCGKQVHGFHRLKHHLGGVGNDVAACLHVPAAVMTCMRGELLEEEGETGQGSWGLVPLRSSTEVRNIPSPSSEPSRCQPKLAQSESSTNGFFTSGTSILADGNGSVSCVPPYNPSLGEKGNSVMDRTSGGLNGNESAPIAKGEVVDVIDCVGRFFFEAGIDLNAIELLSFQKIIDAAIKYGSGFKIPSANELRGWVLQKDFEEVQGRVQDMKQSWERTGCSILFDVWTDQRGRCLINFLVNCPQGTVFLRSVDASNAIQDPDDFVSLLSTVIEEVGVRNVVQVITFEVSAYLMVAGKMLMEKYNIFWTVCVDFCINLMLEKIEVMDHVQQVLAKAKFITRFIYSHYLPQELMRKHTTGGNLVKTSMLKSVASFTTLGNIVSEKENLISMFTSPTWSRSAWSSKIKGGMICELINDSSFWDAAVDILKITTPLIGVLHLINGGDTAPMGFLYEMMDRAKEEIKKNLGGEEVKYLPYWSIVDEIRDSYLYSPLHSAAYYLNPSFFYSNDVHNDAKVMNDLVFCTVQMTENRRHEAMIALQLNSYMDALEGFKEEMAINQRSTVHPATWWSTHGGHCPELQALAVKILSQTCSTSSRYKLRKGASEQLHSEGTNSNSVERKKLSEMEFVENNRRLWQSQNDNIILEGLAPLADWTVERI